MNLLSIWNSVNFVVRKEGQPDIKINAWEAVAALKKSPKIAYRLLKYEKKVERELKIIAEKQSLLVYELAGVPPPTGNDVVLCDISGEPEKMEQLQKLFNEFLSMTSDLELIGITMDDLVEDLSKHEKNSLSELVIELLEPFFTKPETPAA